MSNAAGALEQGKQFASIPDVVTIEVHLENGLPRRVTLDGEEFDAVWCALRKQSDHRREEASEHASKGHAVTAATLHRSADTLRKVAKRLDDARYGR